MIYFILNREKNNIKIGYSNNPNRRLINLQTSNSEKLELIYSFEGDIKLERIIHKKFKKYKILNEWFLFNNEILDFLIIFDKTKNIKLTFLYLELSKVNNDELIKIIKLNNHIQNFFEKTNLIEDYLKYDKLQLINYIFLNKIDYNYLHNLIVSYKYENYFQ